MVGTAGTFVLRGADAVVGDSLELRTSVDLVITDGRIHSVLDGGTAETSLPAVDLSGFLLVPGFVNGHTHVEDAVLKEIAFGVPRDVNLLFEPDGLKHVGMAARTRDELVAGMRAAAEQMMATGTVAFADYKAGGLEGVLMLREATEGLPIRCVAFGRHANLPIQTEEELQANEAGLSQGRQDEIRAILEVADGFAPLWVNDATDRGLAQISAIVRAAGKRLSTHSSASANYRRISLSRTGRSDVARAVETLEPDFLVHMTTATGEELRQVADAGIPMVMCARGMACLGRPFPPYIEALGAGGTVALGTDNVMMSSPDLLAEVDFIGRAVRSVHTDPAVVTAQDLLRSMTLNGARALGIEDRLGSIAPGKAASLVVFDASSPNFRDSADPIATVVTRATAADIRAVLIDGRVVSGALPG